MLFKRYSEFGRTESTLLLPQVTYRLGFGSGFEGSVGIVPVALRFGGRQALRASEGGIATSLDAGIGFMAYPGDEWITPWYFDAAWPVQVLGYYGGPKFIYINTYDEGEDVDQKATLVGGFVGYVWDRPGIRLAPELAVFWVHYRSAADDEYIHTKGLAVLPGVAFHFLRKKVD